MTKEETIRKAYQLFNDRKIDELISLMTMDVHWPNGWEGGYVNGHEELRNYWTRQWSAINPNVVPASITALKDGRVEVLVNQTVKNLQGNVMFKGPVKHIYTFQGHLVSRMQVESIS